ncbi:MAG: outer membrane beta-barrel protein [Flavobacteriaceae bacterium]|nr:outer membrane beta-barrel protein [Flavobacteriaceae bacterium]
MGKKNLEQLFKESFQDFQEVPDEKVWASIEASLDRKKQKKRAVPLWWGLGGAAAALAIALLAINPFGEEPKQEQIITDTENSTVPQSRTDTKERSHRDLIPPSAVQNEEDGLANTSERSTLDQRNNQAQDNGFAKTKASSSTGNNFSTSNQKGSTEIAQVENKRLNASENVSHDNENVEKNNSAIAMDTDQKKSDQEASTLISEKNNDQVAENRADKDEKDKQSIYDAIAEQEQLEEAVAKNNSEKWSVGPSLAPVYFNAAGDGSPVGADFASNSKSGNLNLSYGVNIAYEVGKKVKIRSGVHRVNFGYNTNDVVFSSTLQAAASNRITNIDYAQNSGTILVQSKESAKNSPVLGSKEVAFNEVPSLEGKMVQQLGYIEVPLEVNYAVLDKKFGVDLIGGVSSLFLVDNSVLLESNELVTEMGEANNINSLNFSANFGMGLNYHFTPKFRFNVEPVFKYQLNTFSNVSGNFRPYSIGVYSGFTFKF